MSEDVGISVIVCTRDRAGALGEALAALAEVEVPRGLMVELVVVDNAPGNGTREVVDACRLPDFRVHYLAEPRPGLARARNTGIAATRGRIILFMDDDVRPPPQWIMGMSRPILEGAADAVAGGVRIAPNLLRPWMEPVHRTWLADTGFIDARAPQEMVGASMGIGRHVLAKVPAFDPELGPGALGQGDDSLFAWQLIRAGFRIVSALDVTVEHHFDERRLLRPSLRRAAERGGA